MNKRDTLKELQTFFPNSPIEKFDKNSIRKLQHPQKHAVYIICAESGEILYIGFTKNLSRRFSYLHNVWVNPESNILCLFFDTEEEARTIAKQLIRVFEPPRNIRDIDIEKEKTLAIRVPAVLVEILNETKWNLRKSQSEIVREAVTEYAERHLSADAKKRIQELLKEAEGEK